MADSYKSIPDNSAILELPLELLTIIISLAAANEPPPWRYDQQHSKTLLRALALVCRDFNYTVLPCLYHTISFRVASAYVLGPMKALHSTLQKRYLLRKYCRKLTISIDDIVTYGEMGYDFSMANDLVSWLTDVKDLRIHGGFEKRAQVKEHSKNTWVLIWNALRHMRKLEKVTVSRKNSGPLLRDIVMHMNNIPSLEILELQGVGLDRDTLDGTLFLDPKKQQSAPFTTLIISDYHEGPKATRQLLQWPKTLTHFHFARSDKNRFDLSLSMFHEWLLIHRDTLKSVEIGYLSSRRASRMFKASDFPNLESLSLSSWQTGRRNFGNEEVQEFTPADAELLLAPKLKLFKWDFTIPGRDLSSWRDFGDEEENWLRVLARAAIAKGAALKRIEITYTPGLLYGVESYGYPWDRMNRIRDEIAPSGLELEYSTPIITKERYLEIVKSERETVHKWKVLD